MLFVNFNIMNSKTTFLISQLLWLVLLIVLSIVFTVTTTKQRKQINELTKEVEYYKEAETPFKESIDSVVYRIVYRDSIIYNIKQDYLYDSEVIKNMSDTAAVGWFLQSVWSN